MSGAGAITAARLAGFFGSVACRFMANIQALTQESHYTALGVCIVALVHAFSRPTGCGGAKGHMTAAWPGAEGRSPSGAASPGSPASPAGFGGGRAPPHQLSPGGSPGAPPSSPGAAASPRAAALQHRGLDVAQRTAFVAKHLGSCIEAYMRGLHGVASVAALALGPEDEAALGLLLGAGPTFGLQYSSLATALRSLHGGDASAPLTVGSLLTLLEQDLSVNDLLTNVSNTARQGIASPPAAPSRSSGGVPGVSITPTILPAVVSNVGRCMVAVWGEHVVSSNGTVRSVRAAGGSTPGSVMSEADSALCKPDLDVRVEACVESKVYCLRPVRMASLRGCSRCTLVVAAASQVVTLQACQACTVIVACPRVRLVNCVGCTVYSWCSSSPSIVGDCREIVLAPFNVHYPSLASHLASVGILPLQTGASSGSGDGKAADAEAEYWRQPKVLAVAASEAAPKPYTVMEAREWSMTVVPSLCAGSDAELAFTPLLPVPTAFHEASDGAHWGGFAHLRKLALESGLNGEQMAEVQTAVQAHFREWLLGCGEARDVADAVRLHRYSRVHAQALAGGEGKTSESALSHK